MENKDLKEQLEGLALPMEEGEEVKQAPDMERDAALWLEAHPGFDMITMTKRPDDMPYEMYATIRKVAKRALKRYAHRPKRITEYR